MPKRRLFLVLALAFVLGCRLLLYALLPEPAGDFDSLYHAATRLLRGENPYPLAGESFPYPLPAVLLAVPFTVVSLGVARPIFDVLIGWVFVYALWRHRDPYALLALASGAYLFALWHGQATPLIVAAALLPALGFLLAVRPNTAASLWIAYPSSRTLLGAVLFLALSLVVRPSWPREWWMSLPLDDSHLLPLVFRPFGFILLLGVLRWRSPEGRLILASAIIPQNSLPYELVPLALIPAKRLEMLIYVAGSWLAVAATEWLGVGQGMDRWATTGWPVTLCAVYLPMLYLVLRRPSGTRGPEIEKERRRPHRLPDRDLEVDVSAAADGGVTVKVTHLPTQRSVTESGETREAAERKAHDRLAAVLARSSRLRREA